MLKLRDVLNLTFFLLELIKIILYIFLYCYQLSYCILFRQSQRLRKVIEMVFSL